MKSPITALLVLFVLGPAFGQESDRAARVEALGGMMLPIAAGSDAVRIDFSLQGREVADGDLAFLVDWKNVVELNLGGTKVTDAGLAHLAGLTSLERLSLHKTAVRGPGLAHLAQCQKLHYLNLYGSQVGDEGLGHLAGLKKLKRLYLWQTQVTDAGVAKLQESSPELGIDRGWDFEAVQAAVAKAKAEMEAEKAAAQNTELTKLTALGPDDGSCCAQAIAGSKVCDHPCCLAALAEGKLCEKCNPKGAAVAKAPSPVATLKALGPDEGSCCAKALAANEACAHPCCKEAFAQGELCSKCNPKAAAAKQQALAIATLKALGTDDGSCCSKALAAGKTCEHPCCVSALEKRQLCSKCNPKGGKLDAVALILILEPKATSCCGKALLEGKGCAHPCCKEALSKGELCKKCNG